MKQTAHPDKNQALFEEFSRVYNETAENGLLSLKKYKKGSFLYEEGKMPKGLFYITTGSVKVTHSVGNKTITIRCAISPDFVGYLSLLKHWDYVTTATAIEDVSAYFIPRQIFFKVIQSDSRYTNMLVDMLCSRIMTSDEELLQMLTTEVAARLSLLLLSLNHSKLHEEGHLDGIINIAKKDIASILNITPETLSRNLSRLAREKAVKIHSKTSTIEILSKQKLLQISCLKD